MRRWHVWLALGVGALVFGLAGWAVLSPGWAVQSLRQQVAVELGREVEVQDGAHLSLSPLAIRFDGVRLAGAGDGDSFVTAQSMSVPVSIADLFTRSLSISEVRLTAPEIALLIGEQDEASFAFASPKTPRNLRVAIADGGLRYFDARNNQAFAVGGINGMMNISPDGETSFTGTSEIKGRLAKVEAFVKSLARVHAEGSPFDLNLDAPDLAFVFNGRLATARVLGLTGTANLSGTALHAALAWAGIDLGREGGDAFSMSGAFDGAGRAFTFRDAELTLGGNTAKGNISLDLRPEVPKFEGVVAAQSFDLDPFVPASGATMEDWGRDPLGLGALKAIDATVSIAAQQLSYGTLQTGPGQVALTLDSGRLSARLNASNTAEGEAEVQITANGADSPPSISLALAARNADAATLFPALGLPPAAGKGNLAFAVTGHGQTQQEILGSLSGEANVDLNNGSLIGVDVATLLAAASQRIAEGWGEGATPFAALSAQMKIADGIASATTFAFDGPALTMTVSGEVDLLRRAVDLRADPKLKTSAGESLGLPVPLVVRGPWGKPRIYPDVPDILADPAKAFGQLKAMGLPQANN